MVTINGTQLDGVRQVQATDNSSGTLGRAEIVVQDSPTVRSLTSPGATVTIPQPGADWTGYVDGESVTGRWRTIRAIEYRGELRASPLHTVFYDVPRSEGVTLAATTETEQRNLTPIHVGSSTTDWSFRAPVAELYAGTRAGLYNWGTDNIFLAAREGHSQTLTATYSNVTTDQIRDGIFSLQTRLLVNDRGAGWDTEIELVTPGGTTYLWEPTTPSTFRTLELPAEEATTDGQVSQTGTLQYRFSPRASLTAPTGIMIDNAHTIPFDRVNRDNDLTTNGVEATSDSIRRRVDVPVGQFLNVMATEADREWWVDDQDLQFTDSGGSQGLEISTDQPVFDVEDDRDYQAVRNVVEVQGADGVGVTVREPTSISFYGPVPRREPIVDKSIQSAAEARERGEGFLADNAFDDGSITFSILDERYQRLSAEDLIPVDWPRLDLNGIFTVDSVDGDDPRSHVTITASSATT